ncbi:helix-turn-helix domain-containing protein [Streptomyces anulatus]|uniref:helix-turn-helix domain-containing protein n=1 Tax=Streptomyces anulatus TaxID=1892 RepID=UPI002E2F6BE0|nr:helix-turn-helix domain-containing protein [Streptomyces anulatus]
MPYPSEPAVCEKLLSIQSVAEILDVSRRSVYRYIALGELSAIDLRTGAERSRVRVSGSDVKALVERRTSSSGSSSSAPQAN